MISMFNNTTIKWNPQCSHHLWKNTRELNKWRHNTSRWNIRQRCREHWKNNNSCRRNSTKSRSLRLHKQHNQHSQVLRDLVTWGWKTTVKILTLMNGKILVRQLICHQLPFKLKVINCLQDQSQLSSQLHMVFPLFKIQRWWIQAISTLRDRVTVDLSEKFIRILLMDKLRLKNGSKR